MRASVSWSATMTRPQQCERPENSMNASKRLEVKLGIVCCGVAVGAWTGCAIGQEPTHDSETSEWSHAEIRTESDFYEPLSPYGRWEVVGSFGRCWIPAGVDAEWSPYSNGYWQQSDAAATAARDGARVIPSGRRPSVVLRGWTFRRTPFVRTS